MELNIRLGLDFGTTYCCVEAYLDGGVVLIPNSIGVRTKKELLLQ